MRRDLRHGQSEDFAMAAMPHTASVSCSGLIAWPWKQESGPYVKLTQSGAGLFT